MKWIINKSDGRGLALFYVLGQQLLVDRCEGVTNVWVP